MEPQPSSAERAVVESFALAPGDDLVGRRPTVALFAPGPEADSLLRPFLDAPDDLAASDAVCAAAAANPSASFGLVSWAPAQIIARGDVDVHLQASTGTNVLSGRGSTVWVAHQPMVDGQLRLSINGRAADASTDLTGGSVRAGGFVVVLSGLPSPRPAPTGPVTAPTPHTSGTPDRAVAVEAVDAAARPAPTITLGSSGVSLTLDRPLLIGRNPDLSLVEGGAELAAHTIEDAKISRNHLIISWSAGALLVTDCDSTNGTIVVEEPGARPVALAPHEPLRLSDEAVIYLGDETIRRG